MAQKITLASARVVAPASPTINLRAGTLDDTGRIRPVAKIWMSSAQPWAIVQEDGILSWSEQPVDFRPLIEAWKAAR